MPAWDGSAARLSAIGGAMAVLSMRGEIVDATPAGRELLRHLGINVEPGPVRLPYSLWAAISSAPFGEAIEWRPEVTGACLGATRYMLGARFSLLLMREVSEKKVALAHRLHQQRLEAVGRLVATIAHELRAPLASIVYDTDVLSSRGATLSPELMQEMLTEIQTAAHRLRSNIDGLLEFAKLGPQVMIDTAVAEVVARAAGFVRPTFRDGGHTLVAASGSDSVRGNPLLVEQILVNLFLNAVEAAPQPVRVAVESRSSDDGRMVDIVVCDDGPGVPPELAERIFEPFYTTKRSGTGLGLTTAREAATSMGGDLLLVPSGSKGACFVLRLPAGDPEAASERTRGAGE